MATSSASEGIRLGLNELAQKLGHDILDVRVRALQSLQFKLENELLSFDDVAVHEPTLRAMLEMFNFADTGMREAETVAMFSRIIAERPIAVKTLRGLGAMRFFAELADNSGKHVRPEIDALMKTMESTDVDAALKAAAENTTEKAKSYAAAAAAAAATTTAADEEDEEEEDDEDDDEDAAAGDAPETASVRASVRSAYATDFKRDAPPTLTNETRDAFLRDPRLAASYWRIAREHRGAAAEDVPQDSARRKAAIQALIDREIGLEASTFVDPAAEGGELFLERVLIAPSDQARVFELGVKLTYATDSPALLAALTEMREAVIADLPIQALLQDKTTAVEAVVGLARGFDGIPIDEKGGVAAGAVRTAALATLRTFAKAIKAAIGHAADGAHRAHPPRYDDEFPAFHVTSRAALSYPPPPGGLAQAAGVEVDADGKRVGKGDDADAEAKIVAALSEKAAPVATLPTAHLIAQSVIPLISSPDVAGDALLALEEFLPLLELTRVDLGEGGKTLPPRTFSSVAARLAAYANSMEAALGRAAASVSINGEDELLPTGECPAFFPALALVAVMITAAGSEAAGLLGGNAGGVPKRLTKRLETAAIDELLAAAVPGLRRAALSALQTLGVGEPSLECAAAEAAESGLAASATAARDDGTAAAARTPHDAARLAFEAMPALCYVDPEEAEALGARLVATALTAAASAKMAFQSSGGASESDRRWLHEGMEMCRCATRDLLRHDSERARGGAYAALAAAAEIALDGTQNSGDAAAVAEAARAVLVSPIVTGEIIAGGLSRADTRVAAAKCLNVIAAGVGSGGESHRGAPSAATAAANALLPWLPWLECDLDDDVVGPAASAAAAAAVRAAPAESWTPLEPLLRGLFHKSARRRAAAADGFARAMGVKPPPAPERGAGLTEAHRAWLDPFGTMLRHGDPSTAAGAYVKEDYSVSPEAHRDPCAASSVFGSKDVHDLLRVLTNDTLGPSVRCSAGEQLVVCAKDARLHPALVVPSTMASLARLAASGLQREGADADVGFAALAIVASAATHSPAARAFFAESAPIASEDGVSDRAHADPSERAPYGRAMGLLALAFHPRPSVREKIAVFAAHVVFAPVCDHAEAYARASKPRAVDRIALPAELLAQLRFPVPVATLPSANGANGGADGDARVDETRVRAMLNQRREVRRMGGAAGVLATLERMMYEDGVGAGEGLGAAAKVADATLRWASPASSAMTSLARLSIADSHDAAMSAATSLRGVLSFGPPGANAIATASWPTRAARLLHTPPRSPADARLWASLASTLAEALQHATTAPSPETLEGLAQCVKNACVPAIHRVIPGGGGRKAPGGFHQHDPPGMRHPVAHFAATGADLGEAAAASAAAATAAATLAAAVLDATVAAASSAAYGAGGAAAEGGCARAAECAGTMLCDADLVDAVVGKLIADPTTEYGARVAACKCVVAIASAASLASVSGKSPNRLHGDGVVAFGDAHAAATDLAILAVEPLLTHCCGPKLGREAPSSETGDAHVVDGAKAFAKKGSKTYKPHAEDGAASGGALCDAGMAALAAICAAAPGKAWSRAWSSQGSTFWLTRLSRDRRARRRAAAWRLMACAASPTARATSAMLLHGFPESPRHAARVALDVSECAAVRAAACQLLAAAVSTAAVVRANGDDAALDTILDVAPLLADRDVWRGLAEVMIACAGQGLGIVAAEGAAANSQPVVTNAAERACLRRGAAAALLAATRVAPAVVAVALAPREEDAPPSSFGGDDWPPAWSATTAAMHPAPWADALIASPAEALSWADPPSSLESDAAAASASSAALAGAIAAADLADMDPESDAVRDEDRASVAAAAWCFDARRLACDTSVVPSTASALFAAAEALTSTPPPGSGGAPSKHDAPRRAAIVRAFSRAASGLASTLAAGPDPGGDDGAASRAWSVLGAAPLACALIVDLAAGGGRGPSAMAPGGAGAGLADAAAAACELLATLFRSPAAAAAVVINSEGVVAGGGVTAAEGGVGARLTASLARLWHAQAVGVGEWAAPGAPAAAAPHGAVAAALRNVLAYSASSKRAAASLDLARVLLKTIARAQRVVAYETTLARSSVDSSKSTPAAPKPLAMPADLVLIECASLLKHLLFCPPTAAAAHAAVVEASGGEGWQILVDKTGASETPEALGAAAASARVDAMARGALEMVHQLWRHAAADPPLSHELMGLAANVFAGCGEAKRAAVEEYDGNDGQKPACLAERMLRLAFRNTSPAATTRLALAPLASLAGDATSRRWLLRSPFLNKVCDAFKTAVGKRDAQRQVALLRALADVAGGGGDEGRQAVLREGGSSLVQLLLEVLAAAGVSGGGGPDGDEEDDIDVILTGLSSHEMNTVFQPQLPIAALESLLLLRNVCFHSEAKAHVSSNPRAIDALVAAAGAADPGARAAAADALLALVHNGQRIAALLRRDDRPARLRRAAGRAYKATLKSCGDDDDGTRRRGHNPRAEAEAHASKCLAALVAVLGVGGAEEFLAVGASPDSTLLDIDQNAAGELGEEPSDGLAVGPRWVR